MRNYLIEGVSTTGKTAVCTELQRRGFQAIHGDRELAYQGDPATGRPRDPGEPVSHQHHIWDVARVKTLAAEQDSPVTFFCGGSRNFPVFIDIFDAVFVLTVDRDTLLQRVDRRADNDFGADPDQRELIIRLHRTGADVPAGGISIDATAPIGVVVDTIVAAIADPADRATEQPAHQSGDDAPTTASNRAGHKP